MEELEKEEVQGTGQEISKQEGLKDSVPKLSLILILYSAFTVFCLYKNLSGFTAPLFAVGMTVFFRAGMSRLGIQVKRNTFLLPLAAVLLGLSCWLTDNWYVIHLNYVGMYFLLVGYLLTNFYPNYEGDFAGRLKLFFRGCTGILRHPFRYGTEVFRYQKEQKEKGGSGLFVLMMPVLKGLFIAIPLGGAAFILLSSADAVFRGLWSDFAGFLDLDIVGVCLMFVVCAFCSYNLLYIMAEKKLAEGTGVKRDKNPVTAVTFLSVLAVLYLIFCLIQLFYLFAGEGKLPEGYTYAAYAREGFFQLVLVCMMNVAVVGVCRFRYGKSRVLTGMLTVISLCTFIMLFASVYRMILYIQAYHLTFLRVAVLFGQAVIGLWLGGLFVSLYKEDFPLFGYAACVVIIFYLIFSLGKPDYWIAAYNIEAMKKEPSAEWDFGYFNTLSADALPAMAQWDQTSPYQHPVEPYYEKIEKEAKDIKFRNFNLSRYMAAERMGW